MNTAGRLGVFGLAALVSLGGGAALGAAVGPIYPTPSSGHDTHEGEPMPGERPMPSIIVTVDIDAANGHR